MAIMLVAFIWCISTPFMAAIFSLYSLTSSMTIKLVICLVCVVPTMLFMRVEIEAVTNLIREVKKFFNKNIKTVKKFLKKEA